MLADPARNFDLLRRNHRARVKQREDGLGLSNLGAVRQIHHNRGLLRRAECDLNQMPDLKLTGEFWRNMIMKRAAYRHIEGDFCVHKFYCTECWHRILSFPAEKTF